MPRLNLPKTLYKTQSPISGEIKVVQVGKEQRLVVGGLVQSINFDAPDITERVWGRLTQIQNAKFKIKNCLILGLGGGTVAHLLTQRFGPVPIDGVEIDPAIVEIGKKYFDLDKLPHLRIIVGDALELINNQQLGSLTGTKYSLIVVDLYCGDHYPAVAESSVFFSRLKNLLDSPGVVVFNRIATARDPDFEEKLSQVFGRFMKRAVSSKFGGENLVYLVSSPNFSK